MAATTDMNNVSAALFEATTTAANVVLDPRHKYQIIHHAKAIDGATGATTTIMMAVDGVTAAAAVGDSKFFLGSAQSIELGPGVSSLNYDSVSGSPAFSILKLEPYNLISPH
jgi:hypothetical protein